MNLATGFMIQRQTHSPTANAAPDGKRAIPTANAFFNGKRLRKLRKKPKNPCGSSNNIWRLCQYLLSASERKRQTSTHSSWAVLRSLTQYHCGPFQTIAKRFAETLSAMSKKNSNRFPILLGASWENKQAKKRRPRPTHLNPGLRWVGRGRAFLDCRPARVMFAKTLFDFSDDPRGFLRKSNSKCQPNGKRMIQRQTHCPNGKRIPQRQTHVVSSWLISRGPLTYKSWAWTWRRLPLDFGFISYYKDLLSWNKSTLLSR